MNEDWNNFIKNISNFLENVIKDMNNMRTDLKNEPITSIIEPNSELIIYKQNEISQLSNSLEYDLKEKTFLSDKNKKNLILIISIQKLLFKLSNDSLSKYERYSIIKKTIYFINKLISNDKRIISNIDLNINLESNTLDAINLLETLDNIIEQIIKEMYVN